MYAISSEDDDQIQQDVKSWQLEHTVMFGNPSNTIATYLKEHYVKDLVISPDKRYPTSGMVQPAELVFLGKKVVVAWAKQPKASNLFGALGRPDAKKMWSFITKERKNADSIECTNGNEFTKSPCSIM